MLDGAAGAVAVLVSVVDAVALGSMGVVDGEMLSGRLPVAGGGPWLAGGVGLSGSGFLFVDKDGGAKSKT